MLFPIIFKVSSSPEHNYVQPCPTSLPTCILPSLQAYLIVDAAVAGESREVFSPVLPDVLSGTLEKQHVMYKGLWGMLLSQCSSSVPGITRVRKTSSCSSFSIHIMAANLFRKRVITSYNWCNQILLGCMHSY